MRYPKLRLAALLLATLAGAAQAQDLTEIDRLWKQTMTTLKENQPERARTLAGDFHQKVRTYLQGERPTWQLKYLVGTMNCQFEESRPAGARLLKDILQNSRELSDAGKEVIWGLLQTCMASSSAGTAPNNPQGTLEVMVKTSSAHLQKPPGVSGDTKGGYDLAMEQRAQSNSGNAPVPMQPADLLARRVPVSNPQQALDQAYARLSAHGAGGTVGSFAVITARSDPAVATGIGRCLNRYLAPLDRQFQIRPPEHMITVYQTEWVDQVYDLARRLHGLKLPLGVVAYSVPEDMSLVGLASPTVCGSMAHELVHLLIKRSFPMSPAWLEEGLASEVAVAVPEPQRLRLAPSWRDAALQQHWRLRPRVAELLDLSWADFNAGSPDKVQQVAAIQAMAAVFIRYLDARGKLADVYLAARDQHVSADLTEVRSYREIVETQLGAPIDTIEQDFQRWFKAWSNGVRTESPHEPPRQGGAAANNVDGACMNAAPMAQQGCTPQMKKGR